MINVLFQEHKDVLQLFNKHDVRYLLVGGYAVNYYGYTRTTGDMDLWVEPSNENKDKIIKALVECEIDEGDIKSLSEENFTEYVHFSLGSPPIKVDFFNRVNLVKFDDAYPKRELFHFDGIDMPIVRYKDLILTKFNTGRIVDKNDIEKLQQINEDKLDR